MFVYYTFLYITLIVYYTYCILHFLCITLFVYYTYCILHFLCITLFVYYTYCVLHFFVHYTYCVLHLLCITLFVYSSPFLVRLLSQKTTLSYQARFQMHWGSKLLLDWSPMRGHPSYKVFLFFVKGVAL
jgi:hypothetical protein